MTSQDDDRTGVATTPRKPLTATPEEGRFVPGTLVAGRYRVIALLGRGGMGEVYRATDLTLGQSVALKFLPEDAARNEHFLERFHNEVRVARQVSHPNVCRVYDIGEADGVPFISMEYVDGEDLGSLLLRIGRLPAQKALEITRKLCAGLAAAHERGIIHRDLKPHNIMLNKRGEAVIMDFGLAAVADQIRGPESRNGTPAYMAPEQLRGDSATNRSDIFALGLIAYELFTGKRAYEGKSLADQLQLVESGKPASITTTVSDVDPAVEAAIAMCLQPDPALRPASALAVAAALPGGDPLAAALAAGQTPSPELVAASGKTEGFPLKWSLVCLVIALASVFTHPLIHLPFSMLALAPMEFAPQVMQQKARDLTAALGYTKRPADFFGRFQYSDPLADYAAAKRGARSWSDVYGSMSPVEYWYRQSSDLLLANPDGRITLENPPFVTPGMVTVRLDSAGHLRTFQAIPNEDAKPPVSFDPAALFRTAGLDLSSFHEVTPQHPEPVPADARHAWTGTWPGMPGTNVVVEASSWHGQTTAFRIYWPWEATNKAPAPNSVGKSLSRSVFFIMTLVGMFCGIFYAIKNVREERTDRKGALRVATCVFLFGFLEYFATVHVVPDLALAGFAWENLGTSLLWGATLWVVYLALEPPVRARWPHSLITWSRLLSGQFLDARVGSHLLLGSAVGVVGGGVFLLRARWQMDHGGTPSGPPILMLSGFNFYLAHVADRLFSCIFWGICVFFLLCGLRLIVKKDWLAAAFAASLMLFAESNVVNTTQPWIDIPLYFGLYSLISFLTLRIGLLVAVTAIFTLNTSADLALGNEWSAWFHWITALNLSLVSGIAIFSFWRSQSRTSPPANLK